jgi:hypothetical protein
VPIKDNDTSAIYTHLGQALDISQETDACGMLEMVALTMAQIAGPFAFVYYDGRSDCIFMGRDFLGRRSLVYQTTPRGDILLCSVPDRGLGGVWTEVEADGIYCVDLRSHSMPEELHIKGQVRWGGFRVYKKAYVHKDASDLACSSVGPIVPKGKRRLTSR